MNCGMRRRACACAVGKYIKESGFTMIELLIIIAIIGILASIAIPQYNSYRTKAMDASAISHLKFILTAEEAYYVQARTYLAVPPGEGPGPVGDLPDTTAPAGVGYVVGTFPAGSLGNYVAFTGHRAGERVYGGDSSGNKRWRNWNSAGTVNAAEDARAEDITVLLTEAWGTKL